ncbi:MAG: YfcC family protein, partial [Bacilli bacterium]|nr:YfcC family protein [Bacilli bacterium]
AYPIWKWFLAPFLVLGSSDGINIIMISLFLLILGGAFSIMDKTGGIQVMIKKLIERYKDRKYVLLLLVILVFMVFGAFFGIFEESVALLPIMILLSLSLGWDTMVGIGMCLLAAGFGFASGITNPFSVGIASEIAGVNLLSGVLFRLFVFVLMYGLLSLFLITYVKKIEADPKKSLTYEDDQKKAKDFSLELKVEYQNEKLILKSYVWMFIAVLIAVILSSLLELFAGISIPTIPVMAAAFLIGGFLSGYLITKDIKAVTRFFLKGALSVAPAVLLIMMAASVKHIITGGGVMDTILNSLANILTGQSPIVAILLIYALVLVIQFFIGSASAKAYLIMPLLVPLVTLVGISKELSILAFIFGDGYTNVIFPTNGVLLIGLSIASVGYTKWFRFTWVLQLGTLLLTSGLLILAYFIGY